MTNVKNYLDEIVAEKQKEVILLQKQCEAFPDHLLAKLLRGEEKQPSEKSLRSAFQGQAFGVIAEIKRTSPALGPLAQIVDPVALAKLYVDGGARGISVLTETQFFQGRPEDLTSIVKQVQSSPIAVLRKDFMLDPIQLAESVVLGAHAVLLIVAVLGKRTRQMIDVAKALGIEALVEVTDQEELELALESGATCILVNHRNLKTFVVDPTLSLRLIEQMPTSIFKVAASGISTPQDAHQYKQAGYHVVLIGGALVKSARPDVFIRGCLSC